MTQLQQNRYDVLLRRVGDLKGPGSKVNEVLEELFPTLDVESLPAELLFLNGTILGIGDGSAQGGVAQASAVDIFNPTGSGKLVTVTKVVANSGANNNSYSIGLAAAELGTNVTTGLRDSRLGIPAIPTARINTSTNASVAAPNVTYQVLASTTLELSDNDAVAVLAPGTGLRVVSGATNTLIEVGFLWRERIAEPSELKF